MQRSKNTGAFVFVLLTVLLSSCTSVAHLLCIPWKVTEVHFVPQSKTLNDEQRRAIDYQLRNEFSFRFYPDSVYHVVKGYDTTTGTWQLSKDKKTIITNVLGEEQRANIVQINKKHFRFHPLIDLGAIEYIGCLPATATK